MDGEPEGTDSIRFVSQSERTGHILQKYDQPRTASYHPNGAREYDVEVAEWRHFKLQLSAVFK